MGSDVGRSVERVAGLARRVGRIGGLLGALHVHAVRRLAARLAAELGVGGRLAAQLGVRARLAAQLAAQLARLALRGLAQAAGQVLAVRVLVEAPLGHEQRGDGARRRPHGGGAGRDAAAPALRARVVQHVQARHRLPNAVCQEIRNNVRIMLRLRRSNGARGRLNFKICKLCCLFRNLCILYANY